MSKVPLYRVIQVAAHTLNPPHIWGLYFILQQWVGFITSLVIPPVLNQKKKTTEARPRVFI